MTLKTRKLKEGRYSIAGTGLLIERGEAPRYRERQEWFLTCADEPDRVLLIGHGKADVLGRLQWILDLTADLPRD